MPTVPTHQSREDYLEAILQLRKVNGVVRSIDVANHLHFSKASVSVAVKKLKEEGYIIVEADGNLVLTESGEELAEKTLEKHEFLTNFFITIGVDPEFAEDEACEIEHAITEDTFIKMKEYLNNLKK